MCAGYAPTIASRRVRRHQRRCSPR